MRQLNRWSVYLFGGRNPNQPYFSVLAYSMGAARKEALRVYPRATIKRIEKLV